MAAEPPPERPFRLIFSDGLAGGGPRVRTFVPRPSTLDEVLEHLSEHFGFRELCASKGLEPEAIKVVGGGFHIAGVDGSRRVPVRTDSELATFFGNLTQTALPSVEVQVAKPSSTGAGATGGQRQSGRIARDHIEKMEDSNFALLRACEKIERRLDELERTVSTNKAESTAAIGVAVREIGISQDKAVKALKAEIQGCRDKDESILKDLDVVRQHGFALEKKEQKDKEELQEKLDETNKNMQDQFEDVNMQLEDCRTAEGQLRDEDDRQNEVLQEHDAELKRLEAVKVDIDLWRQKEEEMAEHMAKEFAATSQRITDVHEALSKQLSEEQAARETEDAALKASLDEHVARIDGELNRIESDLKAGFEAADQKLQATKVELQRETDSKVGALKMATDQTFQEVKADIASKDAAINKKADDLTKRCDQTFNGLNERLEEMTRVQRARLGTIERDIVETTTKIRAECRSEIERVRGDYETEAARLDADLGDLHTKHDVVKQEINFFNSRLLEQREWAQRQLTETATATRASQVDSQEGIAAAMKMLHALRDDAVTFREKMAKYISVLQHNADTAGDALTSLESHRGRMRVEIDTLIGDHQAYTGDMDGWANDVRIKVERLFRAMEPPRVEWRIPQALRRAKDLKRPLAVKSPQFNLRGLRDVQMEFYPDGTINAPEGQAILRLFLPPGSHVRYQCWVGSATQGATEYKPGASLSVDLPVEGWKDQILDDGSVMVVMEVLRDMCNEDESLSREVRVESPML